MKLKVIKRFIDKCTKKLHEKGTEFECDEKRFKEISAAGQFVDIIVDTKIKKVLEKEHD